MSFYNEEQIFHFCIIFLICFLRNVIEFVFTSRNFTCTSDSLLSNLDDERKESLNSKVFGCDIQIGQKGFKQTNNLKTYFASGCDLSPKHFTIWNSWSISESPRKWKNRLNKFECLIILDTYNEVVEQALYKGNSSSKKIFHLVVRLWTL